MLTGVILAGGRNRWLGKQMKALLPIKGDPLIVGQIERMRTLCDEIIVVTNDPLPLLKVVDRSVRMITDFIPNKGPLSGIHAALSLCQYPTAWIVGCNMPFISTDAARLMLDRKLKLNCDAVVPQLGEAPSLLHGIYDKSCVEAVTALLHTEQPCWTEMFRMIFWESVTEEQFKQAGVDCEFGHEIRTEQDMLQLDPLTKLH